MVNVLMFCSNPVNGGTARMFYELTMEMREIAAKEYNIIACVNQNNTVEIYDIIPGLVRLPIYSEEEICVEMYGGGVVKRIRNNLKRKIKFADVKIENIKTMENYLEENKIDCVITHNGGYIGDDLCNQMLTAAYRCAGHTLCRVYVLHNDMDKNLCSKIRFRSYDRKISKEATDIVTVSNYTKTRLLKSSFISKDIKVIHNGIFVHNKLTNEEKSQIVKVNCVKKNVLMIGNFMDNKGQYKFIEVCGVLNSMDCGYHFTIIGNVYNKEYYDKCNVLIEKLHLEEAISIYQGINNASEYIDMFDLLVVPSMYDESFGLISVEAMANARPIVAFACGGIPEVVENNRNGFVVPVGDYIKMAEKIKWLEDNPAERNAIGIQCQKDYKEKFSVKVMAMKYLDIITKRAM